MSALAMILTAAMALSGRTETVPGEASKGGRFDGSWEGTMLFCGGMTAKVVLSDCRLNPVEDDRITVPCTFSDTGNGTVTMRFDDAAYEGIYRVEKGNFVLCFNQHTGKRPSSFAVGRETWLFTLHRIKPRK